MKARIDFEQWPIDLLIDYALKIHHRTIREVGPELLYRIGKLSAEHDDLSTIYELFSESLTDLDEHLMKEENILFPLVDDIRRAAIGNKQLGGFHCGTVQNPISVMMADHVGETDRHNRIAELTNNYTAPAGSNEEYQAVLNGLKEFKEALLEHIYIEDELIFPQAIALEGEVR